MTIPQLDLADYVGQRSATFRFELLDGVTGILKGELNPLRNSPPTLSHDTSRTIKRQVSLELGVEDSARINVIRDRVLIFMVIRGNSFPLGRYMFTDSVGAQWTAEDGQSSRELASVTLTDEMFIVDQGIERAFAANPATGSFITVHDAMVLLLKDLPQIQHSIEPSSLLATGAWAAGTSRAKVLSDLAMQGGYFSPWFDNNGILRIIQAFDPADRLADLSFDDGNRVIQASVANSNDLLNAANRFIVISNGTTGTDADVPAVGVYDVPSSAPHSIDNRGFVVPDVRDMQLSSPGQAQVVARAIGLASTVFERVDLATAPDPRHDGYQVIKWDGERWLELSWNLVLSEGSPMRHVIRKVYS